MRKHFILLGWIIFFNLSLLAQDTSSFYFGFAKFKLTDSTKIQLNEFFEKYEAVTVDSILCIGFADTIGEIRRNLKLSDKRAKNVMEYSMSILSDEIVYKSLALGELQNNETANKNRRVDIIVFKKAPVIPLSVTCFSIDYDLLHRINIKYPYRKINKKRRRRNSEWAIKKKGQIRIRVDKSEIDTSTHYYYLKIAKNRNSEVLALQWKTRTSGFKWNKESRYVAKMPYSSYDTLRFFSISEPPCIQCQDTFSEKLKPIKEIKCLQTDRFLMKNIQAKRLFFNPNKVKVRVPKYIINFNDKYYNGCRNSKIRWSKRSNKYSFAKLPIDDIYVWNITRNMDCCSSYQEPSACEIPFITLSRIVYPTGNSYLHAHIESDFRRKKIKTQFGLSVTYDSFKFHNLFFIGGNTEKQLQSLARFQYSFFSYPRGYLLECVSWGMLQVPRRVTQFSKLYVGCDFHGYLGDGNSSFSPNLNIGYAVVDYRKEAFFTRFFIQYEYWLNNNGKSDNMGFRVGVMSKLYSFKDSEY